uniref:Uncharacterized protein n=1 Tax=Solanum lycopersicum TaxID=4081 RepID=A0A3Q7H116_SOLLC
MALRVFCGSVVAESGPMKVKIFRISEYATSLIPTSLDYAEYVSSWLTLELHDVITSLDIADDTQLLHGHGKLNMKLVVYV